MLHVGQVIIHFLHMGLLWDWLASLLQVTGRLQGEREAKILQEGLYKEQTRMYETIREESKKAQELKSEFLNKLESSDATRRG